MSGNSTDVTAAASTTPTSGQQTSSVVPPPQPPAAAVLRSLRKKHDSTDTLDSVSSYEIRFERPHYPSMKPKVPAAVPGLPRPATNTNPSVVLPSAPPAPTPDDVLSTSETAPVVPATIAEDNESVKSAANVVSKDEETTTAIQVTQAVEADKPVFDTSLTVDDTMSPSFVESSVFSCDLNQTMPSTMTSNAAVVAHEAVNEEILTDSALTNSNTETIIPIVADVSHQPVAEYSSREVSPRANCNSSGDEKNLVSAFQLL